jgi:hypothetical protein
LNLNSTLHKLDGFHNESQLEVVRLLQQLLDLRQCALAKELANSLVSINYFFQALVKKCCIKMQNFWSKQSQNTLCLFVDADSSSGKIEADGGIFEALRSGLLIDVCKAERGLNR